MRHGSSTSNFLTKEFKLQCCTAPKIAILSIKLLVISVVSYLSGTYSSIDHKGLEKVLNE